MRDFQIKIIKGDGAKKERHTRKATNALEALRLVIGRNSTVISTDITNSKMVYTVFYNDIVTQAVVTPE